MTGFLKEKRFDTETDLQRPSEDGGRNWSDAFIRQEMSRVAGYHQELGVRQGSQASRRNQPCRHLDFGILTSGVDFCYFKPLLLPPPQYLVISLSSNRKLIQSIKPYSLGVKVKTQTQINLRLLKNPN